MFVTRKEITTRKRSSGLYTRRAYRSYFIHSPPISCPTELPLLVLTLALTREQESNTYGSLTALTGVDIRTLDRCQKPAFTHKIS
jgi:hypothetical protein